MNMNALILGKTHYMHTNTYALKNKFVKNIVNKNIISKNI